MPSPPLELSRATAIPRGGRSREDPCVPPLFSVFLPFRMPSVIGTSLLVQSGCRRWNACNRVHGDRAWQAACYSSCFSRSDKDICTYGHDRASHDLPPRCMHGSKCYFGDRCRYNHIERVEADAKRAYNLIYPPPASSKAPMAAAAPRVAGGSSSSAAASSGSLTYELVMSMSRDQAHEALKQLVPKPKYISKMKRDDARKMLVERHGLFPVGSSQYEDKCLGLRRRRLPRALRSRVL